MKNKILIKVFFILLLCSCSRTAENTVFQISTIDALLTGLYDGSMTLESLTKNGDFGIGTFNALDGEMIVLNGSIYQVKADGKVYMPGKSVTTPFATVCNFKSDRSGVIPADTSFKAFEMLFDKDYPNKNLFYAIIIKGTFSNVKTRSVPAQKKPYPPLVEVAKNQPEFAMENISGTIVGFRCPDFVKGINVPGYYLHFLSEDKSCGGHVLSFKLKDGFYKTDIIDRYVLSLPSDSADFAGTNLSLDRSKELSTVESEKRNK